MNKEALIENFFKSLKVSLVNASLYAKTHTLFLKSVEDLKTKADAVFNFSPSLKIGIAPHFLLVEGRRLEKEAIYKELADFFHRRKIKSIEIVKGAAVKELSIFLEKVNLPFRETAKEGGLRRVLKKEGVVSIFIEDLDYSRLLKGEGKEYKDIWIHILGEAVEKENLDEIKEFSDNFDKVLSKFKIKDLLENEKLRKSINNFFTYLKDKQKDKHRKCVKALTRAVLDNRDTLTKEGVEKLRLFFTDLENKDFAQILWEEIVGNENFDPLRFKLFSRLLEEKDRNRIAVSLAGKVNKKIMRDDPRIGKKIKDLFLSASPFFSQVYQHTLASFLEDTSGKGTFSFDRAALNKNYRYIILNLCMIEEREKKVKVILGLMHDELEKIFQEKGTDAFGGAQTQHFSAEGRAPLSINPEPSDFAQGGQKSAAPVEPQTPVFTPTAHTVSLNHPELSRRINPGSVEGVDYLKALLGALDEKAKKNPSLADGLGEAKKWIAHYTEEMILAGEDLDLDFFLSRLESRDFDFNSFLNKIFINEEIRPSLLKLIFILFPQRLPLFCKHLKKRRRDIAFLRKIIAILRDIDYLQSYRVLKFIFTLPNTFIKLEALRAMENSSYLDNNFLFFILEREGFFLRRESLKILLKDERARKRAVSLLFSVFNPFGARSKTLEENIRIVDGLGLKEAKNILRQLAKNRSFWNRNVREKAEAVLVRWSSGGN